MAFVETPTTTVTQPNISDKYGQYAEQGVQGFTEAGKREAQTAATQGQVTATAAGGMTAAETQQALREQQGQYVSDVLAGGAQALTAQQQAALAQMLMQQATGQQAGAAQLQLQRALQAQQAATASSMGSVRGMNPATAQRLMSQQQAQQQSAMAGQSAQAALEEQNQARQALGQVLGTQRAQDIQSTAVAGQLMQGVREGDTSATQAAAQAAQAQRQGDIQAQAQQLGLVTAAGQIDMQAAKLKMDAAIADADMRFKAGVINAQQRQAEENYWRDFWTKLSIAAVGGVLESAGDIGAAAVTGGASKANDAVSKAKGGLIRGAPAARGDSYLNDTVPAMLSPGEIVIPRSIAQAKDAPEKAKAFVEALTRHESKPMSRKSAMARIVQLEAEIAALRSMHPTQGRR